MKVVLLILHIMCAISFLTLSHLVDTTTSQILYTITGGIWSICVGIDIAQLVLW